MKRFYCLIISIVLIIICFTACSSNNINLNVSNFETTDNYNENDSKQKIFSYLGNDYPVNVMPDFQVKSMVYEETENGITYVTFCSDSSDKLDDIENYDFSNGSAEFIYYIYNCSYNDILSEKAEILGAYSFSYSGKNSNGFDGWEIMYAPDGVIIFKTDTNRLLCGLHEIYYDNNDNIIAKSSGYDEENDKTLFEKADGTIINEDEMRNYLEKLCPNEYLMGLI